MKVAIGLFSLQPGGTEFQMCLLANGLIERGHSVILYCMEGTTNELMLNQFPNAIPSRTVDPRDLPGPNRNRWSRFTHLPHMMKHTLIWRKWLTIDRPDVVIGALALPHLMFNFASLGMNIPNISRRGFSWPEVTNIPSYAATLKKLRKIRPISSYLTHSVICNANHVADSLQEFEGWNGNKIYIINNGWPEYSPISYSSLRTVFSGRERTEKQYSIPGVERVTTIPVWSNVGIYCHPTRAEGCSNSVGMAMSHGIPVIAMRTPGNRELLGSNYQGLVDDIPQMTRWINLLQRSIGMRAYIGGMCQERVRNNYSLNIMVDKWETLLKEVTNDSYK